MTSPIFEGQTFLFIWIGFLLLMSGGVAAFFFWGIRAGQFSNQDRARYLALYSQIPSEAVPEAEPQREDGGELP
jgi:cbb3-type cytochrome oxidase maturation protein